MLAPGLCVRKFVDSVCAENPTGLSGFFRPKNISEEAPKWGSSVYTVSHASFIARFVFSKQARVLSLQRRETCTCKSQSGKKTTQLIIIACMISRTAVIYGDGSFGAPPPLNFYSCALLPSLTLRNPSSHMRIWNVNDHPEGQEEKVTCFPAALNMQI